MFTTLRFACGAALLLSCACSSNSDSASPPPAGAGASGNSGAAFGGTGGMLNAAGSVGTPVISGGAGGSAGSAGSPISAGAAGSSAGGASTPCGAAGLVLCDDFDARAVGMQPAGMSWADSKCYDMARILKVDSSVAHSGMHSLVSQGIPYADCQLHADLGTQSDFYVRAWVYYAAGATDQFGAHEVTVFELVPAASTDDPAIRVGFRGDTCLPQGVELNITGGMEQTGCTGATPKADNWTCYELHVQASAAGITTDLSIDGVDQSYSNHGQPQQVITNPDLKSVRYLRLGSRSYSGSYAPLIYVDDVAVGTQPIGCK